jgi:hypothetical protein
LGGEGGQVEVEAGGCAQGEQQFVGLGCELQGDGLGVVAAGFDAQLGESDRFQVYGEGLLSELQLEGADGLG